jgi:hypothetical protein
MLVAVLALVLAPLGSAESTYTDPAGDSGTAPDITAVVVSNTHEGVVTFHVRVNLVPQTGLRAVLDADLDLKIFGGYTILVSMMPSGSVHAAVLDGHGASPPGAALVATAFEGVVEFSFQKEPLGIDEAFAFALSTYSLLAPSAGGDQAPDDYWNVAWRYVLSEAAPPPPPVMRPVIGKPIAVPARPLAGKRFTVTFPVTRSDDGAPLTTGSLACTTKVAAKVVPHRHTFGAGNARVTLAVPKATRGKRLTIGVKVAVDEQAAIKVFTFKIR